MNEYKEKEWLEQKYWEEGLSTYKISSICSTCPSQIFRWLQKHGIKTRSRSEAEMGKRNHMHDKTGERNPFYGKHHSQEAIKKMSEAVREWYEEHPNAQKGKNNPMYGKKRSEEAKRKTSQSLKGRIFTKQHRERQSEAAKRNWENPEYRDVIIKALFRKPNRQEEVLINLIRKHNLPYLSTARLSYRL
ncbi:unnamed protein product [marine sediment metagenome]|uniref:Nuclease associated modular domain-containing protein n=1 Tax=marine sediment metagenome TaxID=412755 RepID=X1UNC6_9ZZZZ